MNKDFIKYTFLIPFIGIFVFTFFLFFSPVSYDFSFYSFLIIYSFYFFYFFGFLIFWFSFGAFLPRMNKCPLVYSNSYFIRKLCVLRDVFFYLSILFLMLSFYDFFVLGDVINKGVVALREERTLEGSRGSFVGFWVVLLSATPVFLVTLTYLLSRCFNIEFVWIYYFFGWLGVFSYLLSGGRNNLFLAIVFIFVFFSIVNSFFMVRKMVGFFIKFLVFLILFFLILLFLSIFIERSEFQGISMKNYVERLDVEFNVDFYYLDSSYKIIEDFYYSFLVLFFYLNHSIMEFSEYFYRPWDNHTYGVLLFPLASIALDRFFSTELFMEAIDKMILHGVYLSFPGFLYLDFYYFYFFVPLLIGFFLPYFYVMSHSKKSTSFIYIYSYVSLVVVMIVSPIYNAFAMLIFPLILSLSIFFLILTIRRVYQ